MSKMKCLAAAVAVAVCGFVHAETAGSLRAVLAAAGPDTRTINEQAAALQPGEWLVCPMTGNASDIVNIGTLAEYKDSWGTGKMTYANYVCTGDASVNGVTLGVGYGDGHETRGFSDMPKDKKTGYGTCGIDSSCEYAQILDTGRELWTRTGVQTFKLSGLESGTNYLVQVIIHHKDRSKSTATAGGQTMYYASADSSGEWYYGGTLIHVFTASKSEYEFQIDFEAEEGGTKICQINAVQVRKIPEPKPVQPPINEQAAELTAADGWLALPMQGAETDFVTTGACIAATAASQALSGTGDASVAGIPFSSSKGYFEGSGYIDWPDTGWDASSETRGWFCFAGTDPTTDYAKIMGGARLCNNDVTVTLNQLEIGRDYLIQIFIHNGRYNGIQNGEDGTGGSGNQDEYLRTASIDGQTVRYGGKTSSDDWYYGGTLLKVFRAETSTYSFTVNYAGGPGGDYAAPQYNAMQLRLLPKVIKPVAPSFALGTPMADGASATIALNSVVMGTDSTGATAATSYDVFAYEGDDPAAASLRASGQSGATANFQVSDLAMGTHVYHVYIVNDQGVSSATSTVSVKIVQSINELAKSLQPGDWLAVPMTGCPSDIVKIGTLAEYKDSWGTGKMTYANCVCAGDASVNGVPLGVGYGSGHEERGFEKMPKDKKTGYGTCGIDSSCEYAQILDTGREYWQQTGVQTFKLSGLESGTNYLVQVIIHHKDRSKSTATAGGQTMHYASADSSGEWYYGGTLIHVFTASKSEYEFQIDFEAEEGGTAICQVNAIQVRKIQVRGEVTEPSFSSEVVTIGRTVRVSLSDIVIGTDSDGYAANDYDVYFAYGASGSTLPEATKVTNVTKGDGTCSFTLPGLAYGEYDYRLFIKNSADVASDATEDVFALAASLPITAQAAALTQTNGWLALPLTGSPLDVVNEGACHFAYACNSSAMTGDASVNNVLFTAKDGTKLEVNGITSATADYYQPTREVESANYNDYDRLMVGAWSGKGEATAGTFTVKGLTIGKKYLIQVFIHNGRSPHVIWPCYGGEECQKTAWVEDASKFIQFGDTSASSDWYYGGTFLKVIKAAEETYSFDIGYSISEAYSNGPQYNAIQVREVTRNVVTDPEIGGLAASVADGSVVLSLTGIDMGTDAEGADATSYDVYAEIDGQGEQKVREGLTGASVDIGYSHLAVGEHTCTVRIVSDAEKSSGTRSVGFAIMTADSDCYFPAGNWEALQLSKDAHEIRTAGKTVYALACSAGNNGRTYTVNGITYHDTQRNNASWGDWQLVNWADFDPAFNADKDSFGGEDVPTISGEDMAFQTVCKRGWLSENSSRTTTDFTMTLKNLEPGARYVVQLTAHNGSTSYGGKSQTMTAPDGVSTITLGDADASGTCRYGGTLIGTFVASNTTHAFKFSYGSDPRYYQLNSIQLRKTGAAPAVVPAYPTLGAVSVFVGSGSATLTVGGLDAGAADGACDVYYALAEEGEAFGAYARGATGVTGESCTFAIPGIERGKAYVYSVYVVNPATYLASLKTDGRFEVSSNPGIPDEMTVEPLIRPGLIQAKFGENVLFKEQVQPPLVSNLLTQTDYAGQLDFTYGALMANQNCGEKTDVKVVNTYTATQWNWDTSYTVFAYEGEIYLQKGQRLAIFGRFDDGEAAVVDGVTLLAQGDRSGYNNDPAVKRVVYEPAETGWYPLNAWVWDWSSGKNCMTPPSALSYNLSGITGIDDQNRSQWKHLEDTDGKGSFLRFKDPSKTLMTLGKPVANGVDVTVNAAFTGVPGAAKFVAYVSTSHDGGLDPLAWDEVIKIADIPAGDTAAADYTVKGLAAYPFVRFAIVGEGSVSTAERCRNFIQMSCVVGFDSEGLSVLVASPAFTKTGGNFNVVVASLGGAASLGLDVEVSSDPAFASVAYRGTIDGITHPGSFPVEVEGLTPGTTYYIRVKPTTAGGDAWVVSAPVETEEAGAVRINEIMASNGDTFKTKKGRSGLDWIEIYNGTDEAVDLSGWYLYDDPAKAQSKWKKVQGTCVIPVHGYGIVWCDKDYTDWDAENEAWSEIGLSTSGETVFLAMPDGTVVDTVPFGTQMKEISYGVGKLPGSDDETHVFFKVPTPGAENGEYGYGPMTPTVAFSVPHGYKTEAIDVAITCEADPNADIYYTLDGTQPTTASTKYTAPIHIESTTILRAGVPQANTVLQVDSSATYIYLDDVLAMDRVETGADVPEGFPASRSVNNHEMRYGMIQSVVNGEDRDRILRGFTNEIATLSIVMDPELLFGAEDGIYVYSQRYKADGAAGERPMLLEQIDPVRGAENEFSVPGGLRLRGSSSLAESNPKHSLRFFFRGQYGMSKLEFPLFGEEGADSFSKVDLRCSQNYSWSMNNSDYETFVHELFSRDSQRDLGQPYTRTRYYNLFINGQYWGLYMTQERGDKDFGETYLGGNEDYYDCIKTSSNTPWGGYETGVSDGTIDAWRNLQGLAYNGFAGDYADNYNRALGLNPDGTRNEAYPILLNPENLMAYVTIAHFVCDADGPVSVGNGGLNNLYANRYQIDGGSDMDGFWFLRHDAEHSLGVKGEGDEFARWTQYDVDNTGLGTHEYNPLNPDWSVHYRGENPAKDNRSTENFGPYELHAQLAKNPVYRRAFADYFYKHYLKEGGAMTPAVAKARFQARMDEIDDVIVSEAARWSRDANKPRSRADWLAACQSCLDFIDARTPVLKAAYQARGWYPTLEPPVTDVTDGEGSLGQVVTFTAAEGAEIYVTADGTDPAESGTLSSSVTVTALPCTIKARAKLNDEWSPVQEISLIVPKLTGDGFIIELAGDYTSTQELAPTGDACRVVLSGANVPGGLILKPGVDYTFEPAAGTENAIARIVGGDTSTFVLDGEGTLSMTGADTLLTVNDLIVSKGTFAIKSTGVSAKKTPIVKVMGNLSQTGGTIDIDVSVDSAVQVYGIMLASKKMEAEFSGGNIVAKVGGQNKSAAIVTDKGSTDIVFKKECRITAELSGVDSRLAFSAGNVKFAKTLVGPVVVTMPQNLTGVKEAHVFKAEKTIEINGGTFDINVPAAGSEIFSASRPDKEAGEDPGTIVIKGGTFELVADDDCFSATDLIEVRDGLFYAVSLNNDVFDSNGGMDIKGGTILAYTTGAGHEAFDVEPEATPMAYPSTNEHALAISGGVIFATGGKNSAWPTTIKAADGVTLFSLADADVSAYSEKYLTLASKTEKYAALLPAFGESGSILATAPGLKTKDGVPVTSVSATAPTKGSQDFHGYYIVPPSHGLILIFSALGLRF